MEVHISIPYRTDKNLGKAYNNAMRLIPDNDWACFIDYDVQLLTPDAGKIIHEYANQNLSASLMTCLTNRISPLSTKQLLGGEVCENSDYLYHLHIAEQQRSRLYTTTTINRDISGFLMLLPKRTWQEFPFDESGLCLGVDTYYGRRLRAAGKTILRMNGLYVWHAYRLKNGIKDKTHLL